MSVSDHALEPRPRRLGLCLRRRRVHRVRLRLRVRILLLLTDHGGILSWREDNFKSIGIDREMICFT